MPPLGFVLLHHRGASVHSSLKRARGVASGTPARRKEKKKKTKNKTVTEEQAAAKKIQLSRSASGRHPLTRPRRGRPRGTRCEGPAPLPRGGRACLSLIRPDSPGAPLQRTTDSGGPDGGARGERETTPPARPRAPAGRPGALQGHPTEGQGETATARPTGRHVRRDDGTPPPRRGEGRPRQRKPGKASGGCPLRHRDHGRDTEVGPGSAPLPFHAPPSDGGGEERGPRAEREERSHSPRNVRPSPGAA